MKILIMLFLLSQIVIAQISDTDSIIYFAEVYDEIGEWVYKNKTTEIVREFQITRYTLFEIYATVYFKKVRPLGIRFDTNLREGIKNTLIIQFNKGFVTGRRGEYKRGWEAAKDDSGSKTFYTAVAVILISAGVTYGITQIGSKRDR